MTHWLIWLIKHAFSMWGQFRKTVIKQTKLYFRVKVNVKKESESRHGMEHFKINVSNTKPRRSWIVVKWCHYCRPTQHNTTQQTKLNFDKKILLNVFTHSKAKSIQCKLQRIFVYVFWLMEIKGMNIFWCLKNSLATKHKELVANWPLKKKILTQRAV